MWRKVSKRGAQPELLRGLKFNAGEHSHAADLAHDFKSGEATAQAFPQQAAHRERTIARIFALQHLQSGKPARIEREFSLNVEVWTMERFRES